MGNAYKSTLREAVRSNIVLGMIEYFVTNGMGYNSTNTGDVQVNTTDDLRIHLCSMDFRSGGYDLNVKSVKSLIGTLS